MNANNNKNNIFYDPNNDSIQDQILPVWEANERNVKTYKDKRELDQDKYSNDDDHKSGVENNGDNAVMFEEERSENCSNFKDFSGK